MSLFNTNIIEQPLTLSSYDIMLSADNFVYFDEYYMYIFKKDILYKHEEWVGVKGVIEKIGEMPIDYIYQFKHGNMRPMLRFLKPYVKQGVRIGIVSEREDKFKFTFGPINRQAIKCAINVYTR